MSVTIQIEMSQYSCVYGGYFRRQKIVARRSIRREVRDLKDAMLDTLQVDGKFLEKFVIKKAGIAELPDAYPVLFDAERLDWDEIEDSAESGAPILVFIVGPETKEDPKILPW
jgi:hypothetical protein